MTTTGSTRGPIIKISPRDGASPAPTAQGTTAPAVSCHVERQTPACRTAAA